MTDEELERLEGLAASATPGPWVHEQGYGAIGAVEAGGTALAQTQQRARHDHGQRNTDAAFIAAARDAVPALVAEVRRLRALVEAAYREACADASIHADPCDWWAESDARHALDGAP